MCPSIEQQECRDDMQYLDIILLSLVSNALRSLRGVYRLDQLAANNTTSAVSHTPDSSETDANVSTYNSILRHRILIGGTRLQPTR